MELLDTTPPATADAAPGTAATPEGAGAGTAPAAEPARETPYQARKRREREAREKREAKKAARDAKKAAKPAAAAQTDAEPADDDDRDDAQREREAGGAWRLTLRIVGALLYPFGYRLEPLTDKECAEDTKLLAPLARRHHWLDVAIRYAALPYLLVERVATKVKKRDPEPKKDAKP